MSDNWLRIEPLGLAMNPLATTASTPPVAAETVEALASALEAALSPNTRRAYATAWRQFAAFAEQHGEQAMPASPELVAAYHAHRHAAGASMPTLRQAGKAVAKAHSVAGHANPCAAEDRLLRWPLAASSSAKGQILQVLKPVERTLRQLLEQVEAQVQNLQAA